MTYSCFNQSNGTLLTTRKSPCGKQIRSNAALSADGFDTWWNKTYARHTAVVAQASALMRAYQHDHFLAGAQVGQSS
jgi:hypothetical protein